MWPYASRCAIELLNHTLELCPSSSSQDFRQRVCSLFQASPSSDFLALLVLIIAVFALPSFFNFVYLTLIVFDGLFPNMAFVVKYSALISLLLLRLARMAIVFDKFMETYLGSPVHGDSWRRMIRSAQVEYGYSE
jgi:hypothetical protein